MIDTPIFPSTVDGGFPAVQIGRALALAVAASFVIALIEVPTKAKTPLRQCFGWPSALYVALLSFGNVVTTLLASQAVDKLPLSLAPYYFLFAAFFGVFAFETVLKNTNITMFDKGVLTIQDWIEKALNFAAAASIDRLENLKDLEEKERFDELMKLPEKDLNTRILNQMGAGVVPKLDAEAMSDGADSKQYKALRLASSMRDRKK